MERKVIIALVAAGVLVVLLTVAVEYLGNERNFYNKRTVKVAGEPYVVYDIPGHPKSEAARAAAMLASIKAALKRLAVSAQEYVARYPWKLNDPGVISERLRRALAIISKPGSISEAVDSRNDSNTSYTMGKTQIFMCIRRGYSSEPRSSAEAPSFELYPLAVALYPAVHEFAHMLDVTLSTEAAHTEEFKEINGFLLSVCRDTGISVSMNFGGRYCGMTVPT